VSAGEGESEIFVFGAADPGSVRRALPALRLALIAAFEETATT